MSQRFTLNTEDWKRIAIGALIAGAGAVLTFLAENLGNMNFGEYTPVVVAGLSILINILRKLLSGEK